MEKIAKLRRAERLEDGKSANEDRIAMLSDGVFAIACTLLVLDIKIPDGLSAAQFTSAFVNTFLPQTLFYALTFIIIVRNWLSHRQLLKLVGSLDNTFILLNLLFLGIVSFFPAATSVIEAHGYGGYPLAVVLYTVVLTGCGYAALGLWLYASRSGLMAQDDISARTSRFQLYKVAITPTLFLLSLLLLFIPNLYPAYIFFSWLLIPIITHISQIIYHKSSSQANLARDAALTDD
jgi:uncharacterized membrane protein